MPKPLKKARKSPKPNPPARPKRPKDPNRAAHSMLAEHMARAAEQEPPAPVLDFQSQYKAHMARLGAKGGKIGGKRRLQTMTPEQRSDVASKAARAMWAKRKQMKKG